MSERNMADIVSQSNRFDQVLVKPQKTTDRSGNLGNQLHMEDPVGDMVVFHQVKNLGFIDIAGISQGIENAIHINGETLAVIPVQAALRLPTQPLAG